MRVKDESEMRVEKKKKHPHKPSLAAMSGNLSELKVAADLIKREFWVFSSLVGLTPVDFIALRDGKILKVEVKTAKYTSKSGQGNILYGKPKNNLYDILALYFPKEDKIVYIPEL